MIVPYRGKQRIQFCCQFVLLGFKLDQHIKQVLEVCLHGGVGRLKSKKVLITVVVIGGEESGRIVGGVLRCSPWWIRRLREEITHPVGVRT